MAIKLFTDSCCDLPLSIVRQYNIGLINLTYLLDGQEHIDDLWQTQDAHAFYERMRSGGAPKTSQVNVDRFLSTFRQAVSEGDEVLYLAFSSQLSGTANAALLAQKMVKQEKPDANITVIDTRSASAGQGILVYETAKLLATGAGMQKAVDWVNQAIGQLNHWFTVGDLEYLKRGGRISPLAGAVGSLLHIKPVLYVDVAGRLAPWSKVRGRRKALDTLFEMMTQNFDGSLGKTVAISHADCRADADELAARIRAAFSVDELLISQIGPVIGSHAGPETIALFFFGANRS